MLEFALVLPFFLIFIAIMADIGHAMLVKNAAQDAAFAAARAGAQIGASETGDTSPAVQAAALAYDDSIANRLGWLNGSMNVVNACEDTSNPVFVVDVNYSVNLSLLTLLGLPRRGEVPGSLSATVEGVSRCEIVRG